MAERSIIGRKEKLDTVRAFLARVRDGPVTLVLDGEAGIGKTALWETGVEQAQDRFGQVLTTRGVEAEASLSFAGLSNLLGTALDEVGHSLPPPRRRALEIALLLAEPGDRAPDAHAIGRAVLDVLRTLTRSGRVLVDDIQWLARAIVRPGAARADLGRSADAGCAARVARGAAGTRADATGARSRAGGDGIRSRTGLAGALAVVPVGAEDEV